MSDITQQFKKARVLVVGDVMLDTYVHGAVERISPEAPVPVLRFERKTQSLGGAANVAANVTSLGGKATVVGICGTDPAARELKNLLRKAHIVSGLIADTDRSTTHKQRVVTKGYHQIVRLDYESSATLSKKIAEQLVARVRVLALSHDVIVLSDYAKGVFTQEILAACVAAGRHAGVPVLLDPKPFDASYAKNLKGLTLVTPNRAEAKMLAGALEPVPLAKKIAARFGGSALVTLSEDGMILAERGKKTLHLSAVTHAVVDVSGAGDTVVGVCALVLAVGEPLGQAAYWANRAAGVVVAKPGTATLTPAELRAALQ